MLSSKPMYIDASSSQVTGSFEDRVHHSISLQDGIQTADNPKEKGDYGN
jgi:hypothetical protein